MGVTVDSKPLMLGSEKTYGSQVERTKLWHSPATLPSVPFLAASKVAPDVLSTVEEPYGISVPIFIA